MWFYEIQGIHPQERSKSTIAFFTVFLYEHHRKETR